ncbi:MAG: hypothetical protein JRI72_17800, partial [Deltaproteobacteria bacterium]|nr:hypothetical protein [Deltaproteobacteria bacterium]
RGHLLAGMAIGITFTLGTKKPKWGFVAGCAVGLAKEARDSMGYGTVEFQDFAYTCAGAGISSYLVGRLLK